MVAIYFISIHVLSMEFAMLLLYTLCVCVCVIVYERNALVMYFYAGVSYGRLVSAGMSSRSTSKKYEYQIYVHECIFNK